MSFSDKFLTGLATKSPGFQKQFADIMETFYQYFNYDEARANEFQTYIEQNFSYYGNGNQLYWHGEDIGGKPSLDRREEYVEALQSTLIGLFNDERTFDAEYGMYTASHIIIAIRCPEGTITQESFAMLEFSVMLERPIDTPKIKLYVCPSETENVRFFIAVMK